MEINKNIEWCKECFETVSLSVKHSTYYFEGKKFHICKSYEYKKRPKNTTNYINDLIRGL